MSGFGPIRLEILGDTSVAHAAHRAVEAVMDEQPTRAAQEAALAGAGLPADVVEILARAGWVSTPGSTDPSGPGTTHRHSPR